MSDFLRAGGHLDELVAPCAHESPADGPPPDLAEILDTTEAFFRRYVALSEAQYVAVVLWVAHAHVLDATATTPYLHVTSPEAECGKSTLLECMEPLVPRPMYAANLTPAVMFRAVQKLTPTLLAYQDPERRSIIAAQQRNRTRSVL